MHLLVAPEQAGQIGQVCCQRRRLCKPSTAWLSQIGQRSLSARRDRDGQRRRRGCAGLLLLDAPAGCFPSTVATAAHPRLFPTLPPVIAQRD